MRIARTAFMGVSSFTAMARTATVNAWIPAVPPMVATMGMRMARATSSWMVPANRLMTQEAPMAATRWIISQMKRDRVVFMMA